MKLSIEKKKRLKLIRSGKQTEYRIFQWRIPNESSRLNRVRYEKSTDIIKGKEKVQENETCIDMDKTWLCVQIH